MFNNSLLKAVARFLELPQEEPYLKDLPTPEQSRKALERERARSDRTGAKLSLATFNAVNPDTEKRTLTCLVQLLQARLRNSDEIVWLSEHEIGVFLIATPAAGAWKVIDEVLARFPDDIPRPNCVVYTYPSSQPGWHEKLPENTRPLSQAQQRQTVGLDRLLVRTLPAWKRGLDILGALCGLILLAPLLVLTALLVKFTSPGPVLFRQVRSGRGGRPFVMYKFRTMVVDAEARKAALQALNERDGPAFKIKSDPRVTPLGRILRCTSLDELPQLWNILVGDMTLVGPRPLPCAESDACSGWQKRRLEVTPGLTCIWQVRGRGGVTFADWMRMDLQYIRTRSFWHDVKLLLWTIPAVLLRRARIEHRTNLRESAERRFLVSCWVLAVLRESCGKGGDTSPSAQARGTQAPSAGAGEASPALALGACVAWPPPRSRLGLVWQAGRKMTQKMRTRRWRRQVILNEEKDGMQGRLADWIKRGAGTVGVFLHRLLGSRSAPSLGILVYHRVSPRFAGLPEPTVNVTPYRFREQLVGLRRRGFQFRPLLEVLARRLETSFPPRTVVVTFDDGHSSIHSWAWPILRELNIPATIFLNTAYLGQQQAFPFDSWGRTHQARLPAEAYRPLTVEQCREMAQSGLIELGAHTHTHRDLRRQPAEFESDLLTCVNSLDSHFGLKQPTFAFPFGRRYLGYVRNDWIEAARTIGVRCALTTEAVSVDPASDPYEWGRFNAYDWDTGATLAAKLAGWCGWAPRLQEWVARQCLPRKVGASP